jgi:hypothetical protein
LLLFKFLILVSLSWFSTGAEKYQENDEPPETGWKSALKFFQKEGTTKTRRPDSEEDDGSSASYSRVIFLDNTVFFNNREGSKLDTPGVWGLRLGFEWDRSWYGHGVYIQHDEFDLQRKFAVLGGFFFPSIESRLPVYLKGQAGVGYFTGDFGNETLTVDYNLYSGVRVFTRSGLLFNIEVGSKNYSRLFTQSYMNSFVISSGLAFAF